MEVITDDMTGYRLRRRAIVFWIISGVLIIVTVDPEAASEAAGSGVGRDCREHITLCED